MQAIITYQDFEKLELRTGTIVAAFAPAWSPKLLEFEVDFGIEIGHKTILSGIRKWYEPEFFVGKSFVFVVNLAERKMGESISQGMMLMADGEEPTVIPAPSTVLAGTAVR